MFLMHRSAPSFVKHTATSARLRRDPFAQLWSAQEAWMRTLFDERTAPRVPVVDVQEHDDRYLVSIELPGVQLDGVNVTLDGDVLALKATTARFNDEEKTAESERSAVVFARTLRLPDDADVGAIAATLHAGVLELNLPKEAPQMSRTIHVTAREPHAVPTTDAN
jgi:HSP20 family protein